MSKVWDGERAVARLPRPIRVERAPQSITIRGVNEETASRIAERRQGLRRSLARMAAMLCEDGPQALLDEAGERAALVRGPCLRCGDQGIRQIDGRPHAASVRRQSFSANLLPGAHVT